MTRAETQPIHHNKFVQRPTETGPNAVIFDVNDPVGDYLRQLQNIPLLTSEETTALATRMQEGKIARQKLTAKGSRLSPITIGRLRQQSDAGFAAEEELMIKNRRLVVSIAKDRLGRGLQFLDLIQEGNIGLMRATKKFDLKRGCRFSTHATWWIRQAIDRAIAENGRTIRLPINIDDLIRKITGVSKRLTQELSREPTAAEIAAEIPKMTSKKVEFYLEKNSLILSLQTPTVEDENKELGDSIPDPEPSLDTQSTQKSLKDDLARVLDRLPPREARILRMRFSLNGYHEHTLLETGNKMLLTRERVRQLEELAISHLRELDVTQQLKDYLNDEGDR